MNTNVSSLVNVRDDRNNSVRLRKSRKHYPLPNNRDILSCIPSTGTSIATIIDDQQSIESLETGAIVYFPYELSDYKSQHIYIIDRKFADKLMDKIESFKELKQNWDGNEADEIIDETINCTKRILNKIYEGLFSKTLFVSKFEVFPTVKGGIQFEFRFYNKEVELEYSPIERIIDVLFVEISGDQEAYQEEQVDLSKSDDLIEKVVNWLSVEYV